MIIAAFVVLGAIYGVLELSEKTAHDELDAKIEKIEKELEEAA